jgi:GT2 family glycosyltransferase
MKIAVVILNYNSSNDCCKCIGFFKQQTGIEFEIIVVDNNSCPDDLNVIKELCKAEGCTLLLNNENRGYSAGNNTGLRYAANKGYKYALIANPDMEFPQSDYIASLSTKMEEDPQIAVAASDIIGLDGRHQNPLLHDDNWYHQFDWVKDVFCRCVRGIDTYDFSDDYRESHYCNRLSGCCFLVRIPFLQSINFFDEYPFLYCEEAILAQQVQRTGFRMYYIANIQSIHRHISSVKGNPVARFKHWKRSKIYFFRKYSNNSWLGKKISMLSITLYVWIFTLYYHFKN